MRTKRFAALAAVAVLGLSLAACGGDDGDDAGSTTPTPGVSFAAGTTMERLNKEQKLRVGTKFDQPLFGLKGLDGKPQGFDVEVAKIIAAELGISADKIEWTETPSRVREEVIEQNKVDIVVATYTINDTRKQRVDFAGPYYVAGQDIMTRKDDSSIAGPESFADGTKKVCSVQGSTPAENIKKSLKDQATQLVLFDVYSKCADALKNRQVDAVTTDNVILLGLIDKAPNDFKLVGKQFTKEPYGIGVKKGDEQFRTFIDEVLRKASTDGRYAKAWADTAGKVEPKAPQLPDLNSA